jgi:hypothetical protein
LQFSKAVRQSAIVGPHIFHGWPNKQSVAPGCIELELPPKYEGEQNP